MYSIEILGGNLKNILIAILFLGSATTSFACYYEVSRQVRQLENNLSDADTLLRSIDSAVNTHRLDYCDAGYAMITLLQQMGSSETANINATFNSLAPVGLYTGERLLDIIQQFVSQIARYENTASDSLTHASRMAASVQARQVSSARDFFEADGLLLRGMGSDKTADVLQIMSTLVNYQSYYGETLIQVAQKIVSLAGVENNTSDVVSHLNSDINLARRSNSRLIDVLDGSIQLVRVLGNDKTSEILTINSALVDMAAQSSTYVSYLINDVQRLNSVENNTSDVVAGVNLVGEAVRVRGGHPSQWFNLLVQLTQEMGSSNTADIHREFRRVMGH